MAKHKAAIVLCALCALSLSAVAAQSAGAVTGTTLFTCKSVTVNTGHFKGAHCRSTDAGSGAGFNWDHVAIAEETTTEITGTSTETTEECKGSSLVSVQAGIEFEFKSPCSHILAENEGAKSWVINKKAPSGEHYYEGTAWLDYTEVEVAKPAGKGCKFKSPTLLWHIKFTTLGQGDNIKVEPATEGKPFAEYTIEGCSIAALNKKYEIKGSFLVAPDGATLTTTEAGITSQGTLTLNGQKMGLAGTMTLKGKAKGSAEEDTALSSTTVTT